MESFFLVKVGQYRDRGTGSLMEWGHVSMGIYTSHGIILSYTSVVWRETHLILKYFINMQ